MSFMRGVVENAIRNMSPQERMEALQTVTQQMVALMSEQERVDALVAVMRELVTSVPPERLSAVIMELAGPPS